MGFTVVIICFPSSEKQDEEQLKLEDEEPCCKCLKYDHPELVRLKDRKIVDTNALCMLCLWKTKMDTCALADTFGDCSIVSGIATDCSVSHHYLGFNQLKHARKFPLT